MKLFYSLTQKWKKIKRIISFWIPDAMVTKICLMISINLLDLLLSLATMKECLYSGKEKSRLLWRMKNLILSLMSSMCQTFITTYWALDNLLKKDLIYDSKYGIGSITDDCLKLIAKVHMNTGAYGLSRLIVMICVTLVMLFFMIFACGTCLLVTWILRVWVFLLERIWCMDCLLLIFLQSTFNLRVLYFKKETQRFFF